MTYLPQIRILVPSAQVSSYTTGSFNLPSARGQFTAPSVRALFAGGTNTSDATVNVIDYINILSAGNAVDFGDLLSATGTTNGFSSSTRGIVAGGYTPNVTDVIQYVTMATTGNAVDFGDLTVARAANASCSNSTRGLSAGGNYGGGPSNVIDYVTIATTGNATDFGDLVAARYDNSGLSSTTRGVFIDGVDGATWYATINYVTIASTGNTTSFGSMDWGANGLHKACSSNTRGLMVGGHPSGGKINNEIEYITIASTGNSTNFGSLSPGRYLPACTSDSITGIISGGVQVGGPGVAINVIEYVTIASTGNPTDFGDLTVARSGGAAFSEAHGGL